MKIKTSQGMSRELAGPSLDLYTISKESLVIVADNGPSSIALQNRFKEVLPENDPFPTSIIWWDSAQKNKKLIEKTWEYGEYKFIITKITYIHYAPDGITPIRVVKDYIKYDGPFESGRTRAVE